MPDQQPEPGEGSVATDAEIRKGHMQASTAAAVIQEALACREDHLPRAGIPAKEGQRKGLCPGLDEAEAPGDLGIDDPG
nr:hypothetical protein [uncultured Holophaga sp.]